MPEHSRLRLAATARTRVAGVIGDPVRHSLSPALHNAAYGALGLDWVYVAFHVPAGQGAGAVDAMRTLGLAGLSVTMPHKQAAATAVDRLGPTAARLGVVNTVTWSTSGERELVGESTDGPGFIDSLRGDEGFDPAGCRCVVLGTGGAARSVTLALAEAGAASVAVVGRNPVAAEACAELAGPVGSVTGVADLAGVVGATDLLVNATPVGMGGSDGIPFGMDPDLLSSCRFVADLVYFPARTPLLTQARARGIGTANGLGMLIHQAARQIEMWTGRPAPLDTMSAAALAALAHPAA
ncbi:MAG TPA: shikimate dehydrogenase [Acidimicrobiales bacterium]|nr:shikimate dehydrogenase [Acidimicrobiales bacterium]